MWAGILNAKDASDVSGILSRFLLITFADLKKYRYYYWFAFPAFAAKPAWTLEPSSWQGVESAFTQESVRRVLKLNIASLTLNRTIAFKYPKPDCDVFEYPCIFHFTLQCK